MNVDGRLFAPVTAGLWRQYELKDGTYNFIDFLNILEVLTVKSENDHRAADAARKKVAH